MSWSSTT